MATLSAFLQRSSGRRMAGGRAARREIAGILQVLGKLHRGQMLHRDLTPVNVFVCDNRRLKLGDFGIVRQQTNSGASPRARSIGRWCPATCWQPARPSGAHATDVYQVGSFWQCWSKAMRAHASGPVKCATCRCSDELKEIIYRCIGERRKRYESADEFIQALNRQPAKLAVGNLRTLKGSTSLLPACCGRRDRSAIRAARRAGATIHGMPSIKTTVLVRGRPNPLQAAGRDAGRKLIEIKRLQEKGHRITLLDEARFWRLVARPATRA
jgi:hypothetical protein